jgi:N-acyl-D-amino-acid deacylase
MLCRQGVTSVVNGNCGIGQADLSGFISKMEQNGFILNQAQLSGATMLRERAGQFDPYSPLTPSQLTKAEELLIEELRGASAGISFGLEYVPGTSKEELLTLSGVAARCNKLVAVHLRYDCAKGIDALDEMIAVSRLTNAAVQISHVVYQFGYGFMGDALAAIDAAVRSGVNISCDSGMYTSFATSIGSAVFDDGCLEKWGCSYDAVYTPGGKYARQRLTKTTFEELRRDYPKESAIALIGNADEIPIAFELPYMMCSSDAGVAELNGGSALDAHPQDAGTFPRFIREMVRERKQLTLPDAIARITCIPAERTGFTGKGRLSVGADADITVFDINTITDNSRFPHEGDPCTPPDGVLAVIVNGEIAVLNNEIMNSTAGRIIRQTT